MRLENEIKSRKEAESAMEKVFTILKAKGLALDALALASTDLKDQPEGVSALDDVKEMNEDPHKEVSPKPLQNKDETAEKGMSEEKKHSTRELHVSNVESGIGIVSEVDQTLRTFCHTFEEASLQNAAAVTDKPMVYTDNMSPKCPPNVKKDSHTAEAFDEGYVGVSFSYSETFINFCVSGLANLHYLYFCEILCKERLQRHTYS